MRVLVSSFGSAGDFVPALAVGAALVRRGHDVRLVANPFYEPRSRQAGLGFVASGAHVDLYERISQNPGWVEPRRAGELLRELVVPEVASTYETMSEMLRRERVDLVLANDAGFGALWAAAEHGIPSAIAHASPLIWTSRESPPFFHERMPARLAGWLAVAGRKLVGWYLRRNLRPLLRGSGVRVTDASFEAAMDSAVARLGLWSPVVRGPKSGDPPSGRVCGYVHGSALAGSRPDVPAEVESFLASGPPPVVVALGSAFSLTERTLIEAVAAACALRGLRCLIIGFPEGLSVPPGTTKLARYAPYDRVFPRAAAVVVHGGAGTTGEALRSRRPIVGVPFAFDQPTLCARIQELGCGVWIRKRRRGATDLAATLDRVLSDPTIALRAREVGDRCAAEPDGAEVGAQFLEEIAQEHSCGTKP